MHHSKLTSLSLFILATLSISGFALSGFLYYQKHITEQNAAQALEASTQRENQLHKTIENLNVRYHTTLSELSLIQQERAGLQETLQEQQEEIEEYQEDLEEIEEGYDRISDTVQDLVKLGNTDEELLQKYSRVYFLNENYTPRRLITIPKHYTQASVALDIHTEVWPFLEDMLEEADEEGLSLRVISAYRSFSRQGEIKARYLALYGTGANQFSADQGYSEHQLGSTVDFSTPTIGSNIELFSNTPEYQWLQENAHKYGFVLSYPERNEFYQFEPWHWRFVGKDLARDLDKKGLYFYDLEQREIDEYLLEIFD